MSLKTRIMAGIASAWFALAPVNAAKPANVKVEPVFAEKGMLLDTKISGTLPANIGYFMRNRIGVDYENQNNVNAFSLVDLTYPLGKGFDFVFESQFTAGKPYDPRVGAQYFHDFGNGLTGYVLVTRSLRLPNTEITPVIGYEKGNIAGRLEWPINIGDKQYNSDSLRLRPGIKIGGLIAGPSLDVSGVFSGKRPDYKPGVFLQARF